MYFLLPTSFALHIKGLGTHISRKSQMCVLLDECLDKLLPPLMPTLQVAVYIHVSPDPFDVRYKVKTDGIFKNV